MSLSINPLAKLVATASEGITKATSEAQSALIQTGDAFSKSMLDSKIGQLSGELNSGLNGLTAGVKGAATAAGGFLNSATTSLGGLAGATRTALNGIGSVASSIPGAGALAGGINSLQSAVGSTSNFAADISGSLNKLTGGNLASGLMNFAGMVSSTAGMINNILSLTRGANLPAGGELFLDQGRPIQLSPGAKNDWRVRITCQWNIFNSPLFTLLENTGGVVWPYLPNITVSTKANYSTVETVHSNYPFYGYKNSVVEDITIAGDFTCETETDAAYWIAATTFFRTATKMFYGEGALAGNPPLVCNLTGYGSSVFDKVPVIIKSFSVDFKDDVNYIKCDTFGTNTWVPVVSTISVTVSPVYNRRRLRKFSLEDFSRGKTAQGVGYI